MVVGGTDEGSDSSPEVAKDDCSRKYSDDQEASLLIDDRILYMLEDEIKSILEQIKKPKRAVNGRYQYPDCLFRSFKECRRLRTHLEKYHVRKIQTAPSRTKQLKGPSWFFMIMQRLRSKYQAIYFRGMRVSSAKASRHHYLQRTSLSISIFV